MNAMLKRERRMLQRHDAPARGWGTLKEEEEESLAR